jgi:1-acyl-sn-glycerol-3-phosphate acyltransferase
MEQPKRLELKKDLYLPLYGVINLALHAKYNRRVVGKDNILDVPAVYAVNHLRLEDSVLVAGAYTQHTGRPMRFGAKKEYFDGEGISIGGEMKLGRTIRFLMEHGRMIPVDRLNGHQALADLNDYSQLYLGNGDAIALHPEGTRSDDGRLNKFKSGAARIAIANEVPIVPVGLEYGDKDKFGRTRVSIHFGGAVYPGNLGYLPVKQRSELVSDILERRVAGMTGQERSHEFALIKRLILPASDEEAF